MACAARRHGLSPSLYNCGHEVMVPRRKIEKRIKKIIREEE